MSPSDNEAPVLNILREQRLLILELNRPDRLNALTPALHAQLLAAVEAAAADPDVGCVVLTGAGRAFCAGGDMGAARPPKAAESGTVSRPTMEDRAGELLHHARTTELLHGMGKPTIAMINGAAAGAGLALALACDLRIAARDATLTTAYARVALSGDLGISYFLTQLLGPSKARELMFLSEKLTAEAALNIGLVNRVAETESLRETTFEIARRLAEGPAVALRYMKQNLINAETQTLQQVIAAEAYGMARCGRTQDIKEAAAAFREKRAPQFKGY